MIGKTISHYKILEKLGEGGMGVVYKAQDTKLKRVVALKFLPPELTRDPEAKKRFIHEAQAASALDHNNICTIHEVDETEDGRTFIAMACYEGQILKDKIHKGPIAVKEAINIARQIAQGLVKAHKKGIVHRDIKPANIFITQDGVIKILDFGLAKLAGLVKLTRTGTTIGTVAYMSPEQAKGDEVDPRTDIWSLGIVLYEMITGELPFKGDYEQAVMYAILNEESRPITQLRSDVPLALEKIVYKALQKNPRERYQNVPDWLIDLTKFQEELELEQSKELTERKSVPSIAVMPFSDMSPEKDQEYFCDGMAEEIINTLTQIESLRVVARTSAFAFKGKNEDIREIGRKLNVFTVLEGSVRKAGNRVRITAQLIKVEDGYHLWSEKYDREMEDIFAIQDEISMMITNKLKGKLLGAEKEKLIVQPVKDMEAYQLFLKGRYFLNRHTGSDINKAIEYFRQVIDRVPDFAKAYADLSSGYVYLAVLGYLPSKLSLPKAKAAVLKAIKLDNSLVEAHLSLGLVKLYYDWDWTGAEEEFKRARELNPNHVEVHTNFALYYLVMGKMEEALTAARKALEIDPISVWANYTLATYFLRANQLLQTEEQIQKAMELIQDHPFGFYLLGQVYILQSRYEEGVAQMKKAMKLSGRTSMRLSSLAWAYGISGAKDKALELLAEVGKRARKEYVSPFLFAKIYTAINDFDQAFEWLDKMYKEHDPALIHIKTDENMQNLRSDPRYFALLRKMGLETID
ncbi:protein kinase [bacterium]